MDGVREGSTEEEETGVPPLLMPFERLAISIAEELEKDLVGWEWGRDGARAWMAEAVARGFGRDTK